MILFSFDYPPNGGGISRLCSELAAGVRGSGGELTVLTQSAGGATRGDQGSGEVRVRSDRPARETSAWNWLRRQRSRGLLVSGIWYPEGLLATLAGARPRVVLAHGSELFPARSFWRRALWRRLREWVLTRADLVVADSEYTRQLVLAVAPGCKAVAVPLAVDHYRFCPGDREHAKIKFGAAGRLVISTVSRVHTYKGHGVALRALAMLAPAERNRFLYLIAGRGPDVAVLRDQAEALGVSGLVRWLDFVPETDLPDLYRASDLFVLCTHANPARQEVEGFGLVFLEAQACGTPVVGARTGGIPDAVKEGEGGWLIADDDAPGLALILGQLAADPAAFVQAGNTARARIEREATWQDYVCRFGAALRAAGVSDS